MARCEKYVKEERQLSCKRLFWRGRRDYQEKDVCAISESEWTVIQVCSEEYSKETQCKQEVPLETDRHIPRFLDWQLTTVMLRVTFLSPFLYSYFINIYFLCPLSFLYHSSFLAYLFLSLYFLVFILFFRFMSYFLSSFCSSASFNLFLSFR